MTSFAGYFDILSLILPSEEQTWLAQSCLLAGDQAREAWSKWEGHHDDLIEF